MKYLYFTSRKDLKKIRVEEQPQGHITLIPWWGEAEERWGRIKSASRWIRGRSVVVVVELGEDQYPLECYVRLESGEVGLEFYKSLKSDPIGGVTVDSDWFDHAVETSSGGWRSSLRVMVGTDRGIRDFVSRVGGDGDIEVSV